MTILDDRQRGRHGDRLDDWRPAARPLPVRAGRSAPVLGPVPRLRRVPVRPGPSRPDVAPLVYRGAGVALSRSPHAARRHVSTAATITVAGLAALITLWLGVLAHFSGAQAAAPADMPERLAVVQVHAGETLQQLASRMVPGAPVSQVVDRIRHLNNLDSAAVDAGQTLIAPLG